MGEKSTKADKIRALARDGHPVAEIARFVGIRYQHARNVLLRSGLLVTKSALTTPISAKNSKPSWPSRPRLTVERLLESGFSLLGNWLLEADQLVLEQPAPRKAGVYVFAKDGAALYVGVSNRGLSSRLHNYKKPSMSQRTSTRLNTLLKRELRDDAKIEIYFAMPESMVWNGLPVSAAAGLEQGLIQRFDLPWNMLGTGRRPVAEA